MTLENLPWWLLPSAAALILVATHTYLGLHVISRNVFFVDLALAQIAALGSTVAFLFGFEQGDPITYDVSLGFAIAGAWFFSVARVQADRVPQEAIIGLAFAVASAGAILLSAENPHGAEHLRDMMAGSILVVSAREVAHAALLYGVIGALHWTFRRKFLLLSTDRERARASGMRVQGWDFAFYLSFAVIITSSVRIAGVLLVFILLIAPAVCGAMVATQIRPRLYVGWLCGLLASGLGLWLSAAKDWPPAPAISCIFAVILLAVAIASNIAAAPRRAYAAVRVASTLAIVLGLGLGLVRLLTARRAQLDRSSQLHSHGTPEHGLGHSRADLIASLADEHEQVRAAAVAQLGALHDTALLPNLLHALTDNADSVKEKAAQALGELANAAAASALEEALARDETDEWVHLREAEALARCGGMGGVAALIDIAQQADAKLVRSQALQSALALLPDVPGPTGADTDARAKALATFWTAHAAQAHWNAQAKRFAF